jgi:putative tryptophan/tyrosine transport system substrate-binding protein
LATILLLIGFFILVSIHFADAQQSSKVPRIGYLNAVSPSTVSDRIEALRQGLRELGYVEGKILSLRPAMQRQNSIACLRWQMS